MTIARQTMAAAALAMAQLGNPGLANAVPVTDNVTFSATGFTSINAAAPPVDPVVGAFTITFDPTQTYTDQTVGIALSSLNIALGSTLSFSYSPTGPSADELIVGGIFDGAGVVQYSPSTDDFFLHINGFTSSASFGQLGYTQTASGPTNLFYTTSAVGDSVSVSPVMSVPEPATWAMLLFGFAGMGAMLRGARRSGFRSAIG